ncbi:MAG: glycosyltransferase family 4 protein [Planktothrix agardhii]|uniref:glycosyltransferase family 4 protein n=1 Tax=Planktothrix agardhii TaxID=1160 RepID=UPI003C4B9939
MLNTSARTLFITLDLPYPPRAGAPLRNWQNINLMKQYGDVAVLSIFKGQPPEKTLPGIENWYHYDLGQKRPLKERLERRLSVLQPWRYSYIDWFYTQPAVELLKQILQDLKPSIVVFEHLWLCRYLRVVQGYPCKIIFDEHNIEADLFEQKIHQIIESLPKIKMNLQKNYIQSMERKMAYKSDQIWVCSQSDADKLQQRYGQNLNPHVVPNGINVTNYETVRNGQCTPAFEAQFNPHTLVFIGTFCYPPNVEAAQFLTQEFYPKIKQLYPNTLLIIVGKNSPPALTAATQKEPGILWTGLVEDVKPYLAAASVVITPLFKGGGTRLKILEAFAAGRPVVSTTKGPEGLEVETQKHLLIDDTVEGMVDAVNQFWSNPTLYKNCVDNAYNLVKTRYSWEAVADKIQPLIQKLISQD